MSGFIYIMSNPLFQDGLIKIGMSDRDPTQFRKAELETTGVPDKFHVEYYAFVSDHYSLERKIHRKLDSDRPNKNREFFKYPIPNAIDLIRQLAGSSIEFEKVYYKSPEEIEKIRLERKQKADEFRKKEDAAKYKQEQEKRSNEIKLRLRDLKEELMEFTIDEYYKKHPSKEFWSEPKGCLLAFLAFVLSGSFLTTALPGVALIPIVLYFYFVRRENKGLRKGYKQNKEQLLPIVEREMLIIRQKLSNNIYYKSTLEKLTQTAKSSLKNHVWEIKHTKHDSNNKHRKNNDISRTKPKSDWTREFDLLEEIEKNKKKLKKLELHRENYCGKKVGGVDITPVDLKHKIYILQEKIDKQTKELNRMK